MDFASLRQEGIRLLERMAGDQWTDFNPHDPGITILEQLCYVLTDLSYRTGFDIPDLLAEGGGDPYQNLHRPAEILTGRPVTLNDLRRLVLDVEGVKNAWIEVVKQSAPTLYYHPDKRELSLLADPPPAERVSLRGLYRVLIEAKEGADGNVTARVVQRLHHSRGLCEDFAEIGLLTLQPIQVSATVEIGIVDDVARVAQAIEQRIADEISPPVAFSSLAELLRAGHSADEIFDGPRLQQGFITDEVLQRATRRTAVNTSDLIHAIMDVQGVRAVRQIRLSTGNTTDGAVRKADEAWSLAVLPNSVPRLDRTNSTITLTRDGTTFRRAPSAPTDSAARPGPAAADDLTAPPGRNRNVSRYASVQNHFPAVYGIGELGLPRSATPERKAQAKQLKAYLLLFDQLMANYLAQLSHVKDLFAYGGTELRTYFTQRVDEPDLFLDDLRDPALERKVLSELEQSSFSRERKERFLNHLLARFGETIDEHIGLTGDALTGNKQQFLQNYPWLSGARGAAFNYLLPAGPKNRAGVADRLRLKLGLVPEQGETFILVEHILLRPLEEDDKQQVPLLSAILHEDPYSLQLTFVFPCGQGRFPKKEDEQSDFRQLIEQTIRKETPAHLTSYVRWMSPDDFPSFETTHAQWLERRRQYVAEKLGLNLEELGR